MAWTSSTRTLIEGFQGKLEKTSGEVGDVQHRTTDIANIRLEDMKTRILVLRRVFEKAKKNRNKQLNIMEGSVKANMKE
jgi:hypothetical protein